MTPHPLAAYYPSPQVTGYLGTFVRAEDRRRITGFKLICQQVNRRVLVSKPVHTSLHLLTRKQETGNRFSNIWCTDRTAAAADSSSVAARSVHCVSGEVRHYSNIVTDKSA